MSEAIFFGPSSVKLVKTDLISIAVVDVVADVGIACVDTSDDVSQN